MTGTTLENSNLARFFRHVTPVSVVETIIAIEVSDDLIKLFDGPGSFWTVEQAGDVYTVSAPDGRQGVGFSVAQAIGALA
jgi:hypothetical protein